MTDQEQGEKEPPLDELRRIAAQVVAVIKADEMVDGYDAKFWHGSYTLLRDAILANLDDCIRDDDVAEEAILVEAIETAGRRLALLRPEDHLGTEPDPPAALASLPDPPVTP
jgi:hypothetical protein